MLDPETFLTTLYVMVDDFCQAPPWPTRQPGPRPALTRSEAVTLALFSQWYPFAGERDFYRWATRHLRAAFPTLAHLSQFNRTLRLQQETVLAFLGHLTTLLTQATAPQEVYEALDSTAVPVRNSKRRGRGWLWGRADRAWSNRLGWFFGFRVLVAVRPTGVITGFGFGSGSTSDYPLAETCFAVRHTPTPALTSVGAAAARPYVCDKGFWGPQCQAQWQQAYGADVVAVPRKDAQQPWPKAQRRWLSGLRQIVETVIGKLQGAFRLNADRPHALSGFSLRLAAKMALHNFCIWLNRQCGRADLAFADLVDW